MPNLSIDFPEKICCSWRVLVALLGAAVGQLICKVLISECQNYR